MKILTFFKKLFLLLLVFIITLYSSLYYKAFASDYIVIISSYAKNDLCGRPQFLGIVQALKESRYASLPIISYFLNSKQLPQKALKKRLNEAIKLINSIKPKILFLLDDFAFSKISPHFCDSKDLFIIFSGINRDLSYYNKKMKFLKDKTPIKNITGVFEHLFIKEQMEFLQLLRNKEDCLVTVLYSKDFMGKIIKNQIKKELINNKYAQNIRYIGVKNLTELKRSIKEIDSDPKQCAYFPLTLSICDNNKCTHRYTIKELAPLLVKNTKKIDLAVNKAFTAAGFFGGVSVDFFNMGYQAGQMAIMLLNGVEIKDLTVEDASKYKIILNRKRAKELGIEFDNEILNLVDELI